MTGIGALDTKKPHLLYVSWGLQCALVPVPGLELMSDSTIFAGLFL